MKKIIIIGVTGSGKSTLANRLVEKLQYPYIQLDKLFWKANWQESSDEEFFSKIEEAIQSDTWIIDGNYGRTNHLTWPKADTVIWIDLPFYRTLYQNVLRSIKRAFSQKELWEGTGNKESFARMFSKDSIVRWVFKTYKPQKKRNETRMNSDEYNYLKFYRLKSHKEIERFLAQIQMQYKKSIK